MANFDWTPDWFGTIPGRGVGHALGIAGGMVLLFAAILFVIGVSEALSGRPMAPPMLAWAIQTAGVAVCGLVLIGLGATCRNVARIRELLESTRPHTPPQTPFPLARNE